MRYAFPDPCWLPDCTASVSDTPTKLYFSETLKMSHCPRTLTQLLGFHVLWGLSMDIMIFKLYKLYILSPYTTPTPKPTRHRKQFKKTTLDYV